MRYGKEVIPEGALFSCLWLQKSLFYYSICHILELVVFQIWKHNSVSWKLGSVLGQGTGKSERCISR